MEKLDGFLEFGIVDFNSNNYNDNLHPNPLGHIKMFEEIIKEL